MFVWCLQILSFYNDSYYITNRRNFKGLYNSWITSIYLSAQNELEPETHFHQLILLLYCPNCEIVFSSQIHVLENGHYQWAKVSVLLDELESTWAEESTLVHCEHINQVARGQSHMLTYAPISHEKIKTFTNNVDRKDVDSWFLLRRD